MILTPEQAAKQLERSERGQHAAKLLLDFLKSAPANGLDAKNSQAVVSLVGHYLLSPGANACAVKEELTGIVNRNQWLLTL